MEYTGNKPLVSIILAVSNFLEYTKLCVGSLYEHTADVDFELITVNNGSYDGTQEFFNSLPNQKKISISQNCGLAYAFNQGLCVAEGEFSVFLTNSVLLTPNWLNNLLICTRADRQTGMMVPACNAVEYFQQVNLGYANKEELDRAAAKYNQSNPSKWEERLRLANRPSLGRTGLLQELGGFCELYALSMFADADISFRVRRAGYKLILARDTYVHYFEGVTEKPEGSQGIGERDHRIFIARFGVDAWDDTDIDFELVNQLECKQPGYHERDCAEVGNQAGRDTDKDINILGVGFRCGGTLLQIKNRLRENGLGNVRLRGFTQEEKYLVDVQTFCAEAVCAQLENIPEIYRGQKFDIVALDSLEGLAGLNDPARFLKELTVLLKGEGQLVFPAANPLFYVQVMKLLNEHQELQGEGMTNRYFNLAKLAKALEKNGFTELKITTANINPPPEDNAVIRGLRDLKNLKDVTLFEKCDPERDLWCVKRVIFSAKGLKPRKHILLYPGYDYLLKGIAFADRTFGNSLGVDCGENFLWVLREELAKHGYTLATLDEPGDIDDSEWILFYDAPKHYANHCFLGMYHWVCHGQIFFEEWRQRKAQGKTKARLAVILNEPPCVMPENFDEAVLADFDLVFTYDDDLVDNRKYFKFHTPQPDRVANPYARGFADKRLCTFVGSNKSSPIEGELYSERRQAILFFQENHPDEFDFYGKFWEGYGFGCYKGAIGNKLETLAQYKFSVCYENCALNGWISEKIFDSFFAGCVPIYFGAPNISDYIPANTFIDKRQFADYAQLYEFLNRMEVDEYNEYLRNIEGFLRSEGFKKFTRQSFAQDVTGVVMAIQKANL